MADRLKEIPAKVLEWWNKFTTRQKSIIIGIAAVAVFTFAIIIYVFSKPQYTVLLTCDTTSEAAEAVDILDGAGIAYELSSDGMKIQVDSSDKATASLALASAGYAPDDVALSDYLNGGLSTTASDKQKYYQEYMEKYIIQTFSGMSAVKNVRVHLNIPEQTGTLSDQQRESSAYIQLELDGTFTSANAANLAKAAATILGNETTANITILDQESNLLFAGGDDYSTAGVASSMQELKNTAESYMANQVKKVLYATNQFNSIEVTSYLDMDFSEYQESVKEYYANDGYDQGMLAHQSIFESESTNDGGGTIPGTDSNDSDVGTTYVSPDSSSSESSSTETDSDYLPNERLTTTTENAGGIDRGSSSISVAAIRFNEIYEEDVERQGLLDGTTWEEYKLANGADSRIEVDTDFYSLVAQATGISEDNITIVAYETPIFYDKEAFDVNWQTVASVVMLILILALLAFVVLRSMRARSAAAEEEELSVENLLQSTPEAELEDIDVEAKSETRKLIEKFVDENPEAAASLLRNWLNEEWE